MSRAKLFATTIVASVAMIPVASAGEVLEARMAMSHAQVELIECAHDRHLLDRFYRKEPLTSLFKDCYSQANAWYQACRRLWSEDTCIEDVARMELMLVGSSAGRWP
jgi:hypothetical protein